MKIALIIVGGIGLAWLAWKLFQSQQPAQASALAQTASLTTDNTGTSDATIANSTSNPTAGTLLGIQAPNLSPGGAFEAKPVYLPTGRLSVGKPIFETPIVGEGLPVGVPPVESPVAGTSPTFRQWDAAVKTNPVTLPGSTMIQYNPNLEWVGSAPSNQVSKTVELPNASVSRLRSF